jgi:cytochrome c peroxidase
MEPTSRVPRPATGSGTAAPTDPIVAGYLVFTGKGQCGTCHPPPLYTDLGFHKTYTGPITDPGRGKVDPKQDGAMKTPSLRGASTRTAFFHDGAKTSLDGVLDTYAANADLKIALTAQERTSLVAFLVALSPRVTAAPKPILP